MAKKSDSSIVLVLTFVALFIAACLSPDPDAGTTTVPTTISTSVVDSSASTTTVVTVSQLEVTTTTTAIMSPSESTLPAEPDIPRTG